MNQNSSLPLMANSTAQQRDYRPYFYTEFASAIYLSVLSPITVAANGLLLAAIYKDPLKCFRTPVTYFIVGLALVDLLTGLAVEPFFAVYYFARFYQGFTNVSPAVALLNTIAAYISTVGLSCSFLIVLALTCSQFIAITFPHKYKIYITKRRVLVCMIITVFYFIAFSLIQFTNISMDLFYKLDLYLHATLIPLLLLISHAFVFRSFRRFIKKSEGIGKKPKRTPIETSSAPSNGCSSHSTPIANPRKTRDVQSSKQKANQRQLTVVTLLLSAVLLLCSLPHTIAFYCFLHKKWVTYEEELAINIALRVSDDVLFLKVLLDPFIYCWRLPKYRVALRNTLMCKRKSENHSTELIKFRSESS